MSSRTISVGNFTRHVDTPEDPFTARVMAIKNDDASNLDDNPENWPADKIRAAAEMFQREDTVRHNQQQSGINADAFLTMHPEIYDTQRNAELFKHELHRMFGESLLTVNEYEAAYESLRASNLLSLNKTEVEKQRKAADKARYAAQKAQTVTPSEQDLYDMPLDELRRRDTVEAQKRMQRAGERGGNGF
jgi:hypothetical protein